MARFDGSAAPSGPSRARAQFRGLKNRSDRLEARRRRRKGASHRGGQTGWRASERNGAGVVLGRICLRQRARLLGARPCCWPASCELDLAAAAAATTTTTPGHARRHHHLFARLFVQTHNCALPSERRGRAPGHALEAASSPTSTSTWRPSPGLPASRFQVVSGSQLKFTPRGCRRRGRGCAQLDLSAEAAAAHKQSLAAAARWPS